MCGIVGYIGSQDATPIVLETLRRLEYRGYDSVGLATAVEGQGLRIDKTPGRIDALQAMLPEDGLDSRVGIGHSRWATHGEPTVANAHPHLGGEDSLAIVHNGVIENHDQLRSQLEAEGYSFRSQTDSEVIAHLIHRYLPSPPPVHESVGDAVWLALTAVSRAVKHLEGSYAIVVLFRDLPHVLFAARHGSPLVIGDAGHGHLIGSDAHAVRGRVSEIVRLADDQLAIVRTDGFGIFNTDLVPVASQVERVTGAAQEDLVLGDYPHFTLQEIHEQPRTLERAIAGDFTVTNDRLRLAVADGLLDGCGRISLVACGTSWHAGLYAKYLIEELAGIPVDIEVASEYRYRTRPRVEGTLMVAVSQSGETADTLAAMREFRAAGQPALAVCNVPGSTLAEEADAALFLGAGQESGVAATKTYTAQLALFARMAIDLGARRAGLNGRARQLETSLGEIPSLVSDILAQDAVLRELAERYVQAERFLFVGRGFELPTALEGALKLKEISYIHAEGYAAGELKHGPLALVDAHTPTVALATPGRTYDKMLSNLQEIAARGGPILAVAGPSDTRVEQVADCVIRVPTTAECLQPLLNIIPLQLLAYHVADLRGCDVDRPRNLAKSVTVE